MIVRCILLVVMCSFVACTTNNETKIQKQKPKITNPNGMSEMSLMMEDWYSAMENISTTLKNGSTVQFIAIEKEKIFTAKTSKPNVHGDHFNAFAEGFFVNYETIAKGATRDEQIKQLNQTVTACVNCHQQFCHGPLVRIKKLFVQ